jgi:hypothetical protein
MRLKKNPHPHKPRMGHPPGKEPGLESGRYNGWALSREGARDGPRPLHPEGLRPKRELMLISGIGFGL